MGFFNELAGWAHIANVNMHEVFSSGSKDDGNVNDDRTERRWFDMDNIAKATAIALDQTEVGAYCNMMLAIWDGNITPQDIIPQNVSKILPVVNIDGNRYTENDVLSAIYAYDVILFLESKGMDLLDDNTSATTYKLSRYVASHDVQTITPDEVAETLYIDKDIVNKYFELLNEYAARNKALILGCDITDSCDAAEISEFLRKNNISADSVDIEEIKKQFPKFTKERINTLLGTIQLIAFVENRGLDLLNTPKLMDIVSYIAKLEPESGLPSSEKIAEATGASKELVEKYCGILREYVQEHRNR